MSYSSTSTFVLKLLTALVEQQAVSKQEALVIEQNFASYGSGQIDYFLLDEGLVTQEQLLAALSVVYQVPFYDVRGHFFEHAMLHLFPKELLLSFEMIPVAIDEDIMIMVVADPLSDELLVSVGNYVAFDVEFCVGLKQDILDAIEEYYDLAVTQEQDPEGDQEDEEQEEFSTEDSIE